MPYKFNVFTGNFDVVTASTTGAGTGNVTGPAASTDSNFALFDGTTGDTLKDGNVKAADFAVATHTHTGLAVTTGNLIGDNITVDVSGSVLANTTVSIPQAVATDSNVTFASGSITNINSSLVTAVTLLSTTATIGNIVCVTLTGTTVGVTTVTATTLAGAVIDTPLATHTTISTATITATTLAGNNVDTSTLTAATASIATVSATTLAGAVVNTALATHTTISTATVTATTLAGGVINTALATHTTISTATITATTLAGANTVSALATHTTISTTTVTATTLAGSNVLATTATFSNCTILTTTAGLLIQAGTLILDGAGSALGTGLAKGCIVVPYASTLNKVTLLLDATGNIDLNILRNTYANYPPTTTASQITGTLSLTATNKLAFNAAAAWTRTIAAGDILNVYVISASTATNCTVAVDFNKTT